MVGLRNCSTWEPLLLKSSCIKSCANGCSLGITAHLSYANADTESVEGVFIYPLGEKEVVVGFEAAIAGRLVGGPDPEPRETGVLFGLLSRVRPGHLILDEDLERTTFIVGTGLIAPMDIVSISISTTLELPTLENGAIRIVYPTLLTPIVTGQVTSSKSENGGKSEESGPTSCFGATSGKQDRALDPEQQCAHSIFTSPAANLAPYELNFQLLVRGACLLAGLESPTHALRADADPSAQSASATYITLAQEHPYDRHIEVILHLSEAHSPLVILERGRFSFGQYEEQISSRRDFIRCTRKDSEPERKLEFVRKRYHKDILSSPVLMLNFCPDLLGEPLELHRATRELLFLVDRSGSMSGTKIQSVKEAMVIALKSLPPGTKLNIVGFGTTIKPLFTSSKLSTDVTILQACEYLQRMRADMKGTNLLGALSWVYQQPMQRSYPRQVFIITDGCVSNVAKVLELVRRNACAGRCFGLGLGPKACRRLLQGVAKLTGGTAEYLDDEERLQPKVIKSLKKAFEPVLTDVRVDWYLPENMEALLSPNDIPPLYPGNRLIGYCTLYDMTGFKLKTESHRQDCKGVHRGSTGSVFGLSNDELSPSSTTELMPVVTGTESSNLEEAVREISREISSEFSCARDVTDPGSSPGVDIEWSSDVRERIQQSSYIQEHSEPSLQTHSHTRASTNSDSAGGVFLPDPHSPGSVLDTGSLPQGLEKMPPPEQRSSLCRWADTAWSQNLSGETDSSADKVSDGDRTHSKLLTVTLLFLPPDRPSGSSAAPPDPQPGQCRALIHGLLNGRAVSWEVSVDLGHLWTPEHQETPVAEKHSVGTGEEGNPGEGWGEMIHQLTARSVIRDFEKMAEKEGDTRHGSAKRYRTKAIQTSKHCNIICMYTTFTTTDGNPSQYVFLKRTSLDNRWSVHSGSRRNKAYSAGLGRRRTSRDSEDTDPDDWPSVFLAVTDVGDRVFSATAPSLTGVSCTRSQRSIESKSMESFFGARFPLGRLRSSISSGKQVPLKSHCLSAEIEKQPEAEALDYLPLVSPALASGAFLLTEIYSDCLQIPLERLKRASPYSLHRRSLSPPFRCTSPSAPSLSTSDSGRGSETDICEGSSIESAALLVSSQLAQEELESSSWATAVALAWLEHRCAGYFMEWELVAAKADFWLRCQDLPEGLDLAGLRGAARQLFLLLRHWDENIKLNMLC
uniref:von Willebrand factor A domain containing 5B2 n=1 Tax=Tetraodon nigroviridis TaxID=99883 RepID=H3DCV8_TETNG